MRARLREGRRPGGIVPQAPHATPGINVRPSAMTVAVFMAGLVPVTVCGSANLASMAIIAVLWGATHTSGMLISQVWLTSEASEAPEFATSLFVSAGNGGVVLGSALGGSFINAYGVQGIVWCGLIFCLLSLAAIAAKVLLYPAPSGRATAAK